MRADRAATFLLIGLAACATPGQVRRVETAVAAANSDRARGDSALRSDLARFQIQQRQYGDSLNAIIRRLGDGVQRLDANDAANFDKLFQQLYQLANLSNTTAANLSRMKSTFETAVSNAPIPGYAADSGRISGVVIPQPDGLMTQANNMLEASAVSSARVALNTLLRTYPQAPQVPAALLLMGKSFDPAEPDSARVYYSRVWKSYATEQAAAPTALYKLGLLEQRAGQITLARGYWQTIVDKYPASLEASSARDRLRENP